MLELRGRVPAHPRQHHDPHVHPRPRRGDGHVRAGVCRRRAGVSVGDRPARVPAPQPRRHRPAEWQSLVEQGTAGVLPAGAERIGWQGRNQTPRSTREGHLLIGLGMPTAVYPVPAFPGLQPQRALARLYADGTAVVQAGTQEIGTGVATAMTQVAADGLGLPLERVRFDLGDTELPNTSSAVGSAGAGLVSSAVHIATTTLRDQLIARAVADARSPLHGADPGSVMVEAGRMVLRDQTAVGETYGELLKR